MTTDASFGEPATIGGQRDLRGSLSNAPTKMAPSDRCAVVYSAGNGGYLTDEIVGGPSATYLSK
jgi:hypothetical protein